LCGPAAGDAGGLNEPSTIFPPGRPLNRAVAALTPDARQAFQ